MNATTTPAFVELQTGINEALAELGKLTQYCRDSLDLGPDDARTTLVDLEHQIQDAADLIRAHVTLYKRAASKGRQV
ncbi:MAG: hypothetical protein EOM10_13990 [Opitutae bacterium]|nr:hypothetical protein [Opitutae bacterium]